ncbi:MAG TPA: GerMN domain-containing protein, partial [Pyrinomonadaceae bacterium]|nr:GerMN domain-containing protein [Pyrinomonadaceae bacterium]
VAARPATAQNTRARSRTIKLFFSNERLQKWPDRCGEVFAVRRTIPSTPSVAADTLRQLLRGPTRAERRRGYHSWFSARTARALINVRVRGGAAYVNLRDFSRVISGASSSCGSEQFFAQVETTLRQFPSVRKVFYAFDGDPAPFYEWMQLECPDELRACTPASFREE